MRADLLPLGFLVTPSLAHGQVTIDVSKVTCDQFAQARVGDPRTTAVWLNGYYNGKTGSTTVDTQESEAIFAKLMNFCRSEDNGKVLVMQAIERLLKPRWRGVKQRARSGTVKLSFAGSGSGRHEEECHGRRPRH